MNTRRFLQSPVMCAAAVWLCCATGKVTRACGDPPSNAGPERTEKQDARPDQSGDAKTNPKADDAVAKTDVAKNKSDSASAKPAASPEAALATALLGSLTTEHMKQLGQMLETDWRNRPEWGDMAVAVLKGDRMRVGVGWWKTTEKRYDWSWLRANFDTDGDGKIDRTELPIDLPNVAQLFARLDRDLDGQVTPADLEPTEPTGPANMPAMIASYLFGRLDKDSNGRVSLDEIAEFFANADSENLSFLTPEDLRAALDDQAMRRATEVRRASEGDASRVQPASSGEPSPADMLRMFLTGQLGWLESGPEYGDAAPDFTLPTHDGSKTVTLSDSRGKRPVVLIFGSFT